MSRESLIIPIGMLFLAVLSGCSGAKIKEKSSDREVFQAAESLIADEEYIDAITILKEMINDHASSPLLENAYFEIGRAYYLDEQNVEAEVALDDFTRLYPDSKLMPAALLLKGRNLERDREKAGRDQSNTEGAIALYTQIVEKHEGSPEAKKAILRIKELKNDLARHEVLIARFYIKLKKLPSAEKRLKVAFEKYSDTKTAPEIVNLLAETYLSENKSEEARKLLEFMENYYPDREETANLREEIEGDTQ
ncbi:MAG: outer membrane protein assembly factor BamD [Deltaproteobacteria bacterium]|nr:outer membrane protein assembly factor BamD [Deltaproteobacteria bacterium]